MAHYDDQDYDYYDDFGPPPFAVFGDGGDYDDGFGDYNDYGAYEVFAAADHHHGEDFGFEVGLGLLALLDGAGGAGAGILGLHNLGLGGGGGEDDEDDGLANLPEDDGLDAHRTSRLRDRRELFGILEIDEEMERIQHNQNAMEIAVRSMVREEDNACCRKYRGPEDPRWMAHQRVKSGPPNDKAAGVWPRGLRYFNRACGAKQRSEELARCPLRKLRWMLDHGLRGKNTGDALYYALRARQLDKAELLARHPGVDLVQVWTKVINESDFDAILWFLDRPGLVDVDAEVPSRVYRHLGWTGQTALTTVVGRFRDPRVEKLVEKLLEQGADPNKHPSHEPRYKGCPPPLSIPMSSDCMKLLLEAKADPLFARYPEERPFLVHLANSRCLDLLLNAGAEVPQDVCEVQTNRADRNVPYSLMAKVILDYPMTSILMALQGGAPLVVSHDQLGDSCAIATVLHRDYHGFWVSPDSEGYVKRDHAKLLDLLMRYPWPRKGWRCCTEKDNRCLRQLVIHKTAVFRRWLRLGHPFSQAQVEDAIRRPGDFRYMREKATVNKRVTHLLRRHPHLEDHEKRRQHNLEPAWKAVQKATGLSSVVASLCLQAWVVDFQIRI